LFSKVKNILIILRSQFAKTPICKVFVMVVLKLKFHYAICCSRWFYDCDFVKS